jgi:large subunit ribosomal protein L22
MEVQAQARWVRTSPRKLRLVAMPLRGLPVAEALTACQFMPKSAARDVAKVIRSAQANAEHNFNLVKDDLVLKEIRIEPGPMMKRGQPRAMGRLFSIFKRTSHIIAVVEDRPGTVKRRRPAPPRPAPAAAAPAPAAPARAQAPRAEPKPKAEKAAPKKEAPAKPKTEAKKKEEPKKEREKKEKGK